METIFTKEIISSKLISRVIGVFIFTIFTALSGFVRIPLPFSPVPITLQTFFVLLAPAFLGRGLGFTSQLLYVFLGILGAPVFSHAGSGLLYIFGPTGGYLLGFLLASFLVGSLLKYYDKSKLSVFLTFCLGDFLLLASGTFWLWVIFRLEFSELIYIGFLPFIAGDLIKISLATILYLRLKSRIKAIFWAP